MGKIITRGTASREVQYDRVTVNLLFTAKEVESKRAIKMVTEESEDFLTTMEKEGIDITRIEAKENSISRERWHDEDPYAEMSREISFDIEYDLTFIAAITEIIEDGSYSVTARFNPYISDTKDVHHELILEATHNARKKADMIAGATGAKVVGVERIKVEEDNDYIFDDDEEEGDVCHKMSCEGAHFLRAAERKFSKLKIPTSREQEEVYVEWKLEDIVE